MHIVPGGYVAPRVSDLEVGQILHTKWNTSKILGYSAYWSEEPDEERKVIISFDCNETANNSCLYMNPELDAHMSYAYKDDVSIILSMDPNHILISRTDVSVGDIFFNKDEVYLCVGPHPSAFRNNYEDAIYLNLNTNCTRRDAPINSKTTIVKNWSLFLGAPERLGPGAKPLFERKGVPVT